MRTSPSRWVRVAAAGAGIGLLGWLCLSRSGDPERGTGPAPVPVPAAAAFAANGSQLPAPTVLPAPAEVPADDRHQWTLVARLVLETGEPVPGVQVIVQQQTHSATASTDLEGCCLATLDPGVVMGVVARAPGFVWIADAGEFPEEPTTSADRIVHQTFVLRGLRAVIVRAVDAATGLPLSAAPCFVDAKLERGHTASSDLAWTDAHGCARLLVQTQTDREAVVRMLPHIAALGDRRPLTRLKFLDTLFPGKTMARPGAPVLVRDYHPSPSDRWPRPTEISVAGHTIDRPDHVIDVAYECPGTLEIRFEEADSGLACAGIESAVSNSSLEADVACPPTDEHGVTRLLYPAGTQIVGAVPAAPYAALEMWHPCELVAGSTTRLVVLVRRVGASGMVSSRVLVVDELGAPVASAQVVRGDRRFSTDAVGCATVSGPGLLDGPLRVEHPCFEPFAAALVHLEPNAEKTIVLSASRRINLDVHFDDGSRPSSVQIGMYSFRTSRGDTVPRADILVPPPVRKLPDGVFSIAAPATGYPIGVAVNVPGSGCGNVLVAAPGAADVSLIRTTTSEVMCRTESGVPIGGAVVTSGLRDWPIVDHRVAGLGGAFETDRRVTDGDGRVTLRVPSASLSLYASDGVGAGAIVRFHAAGKSFDLALCQSVATFQLPASMRSHRRCRWSLVPADPLLGLVAYGSIANGVDGLTTALPIRGPYRLLVECDDARFNCDVLVEQPRVTLDLTESLRPVVPNPASSER